jgi:hypothetical protein
MFCQSLRSTYLQCEILRKMYLISFLENNVKQIFINQQTYLIEYADSCISHNLLKTSMFMVRSANTILCNAPRTFRQLKTFSYFLSSYTISLTPYEGVVNFVPLAPHRCWFRTRERLRNLLCLETVQLEYWTSSVILLTCPNNARRCIWGHPPPAKLIQCNITFTVLMKPGILK